MADRTVTGRAGRTLGLSTMGDPASDRIAVLCHPAPGSSGFDPDPRLTDGADVHLIAIDRPGYGDSDPVAVDEAPTIARAVDDVADYVHAISAELRLIGRPAPDRIGVAGWSAGGRIALALAARLPDLIDRVAVVATPAPDSAVSWVPDRYARMNAELLALPPAEAKAQLRPLLQDQVGASGPTLGLLTDAEVDAAALEQPGVPERLERMLAAAYRQGAVGVADDILSYAGDDWGFDLADVRADVLLVYGAKDEAVPSAHGRWYRRQLPNAHLTVVPRAGHLVIVPAWQQVLEHIAPPR